MQQSAGGRSRVVTIAVWTATVLVTLGIGLAGALKFVQAEYWRSLFTGWGYPSWMSPATGVAEMAGAIALLVPRLAFYAAIVLLAVMVGAFVTLLAHSGGPMGWGGTPLVYIALLAAIAVVRRRDAKRRPDPRE